MSITLRERLQTVVSEAQFNAVENYGEGECGLGSAAIALPRVSGKLLERIERMLDGMQCPYWINGRRIRYDTKKKYRLWVECRYEPEGFSGFRWGIRSAE
jgi:hypothetical protein